MIDVQNGLGVVFYELNPAVFKQYKMPAGILFEKRVPGGAQHDIECDEGLAVRLVCRLDQTNVEWRQPREPAGFQESNSAVCAAIRGLCAAGRRRVSLLSAQGPA